MASYIHVDPRARYGQGHQTIAAAVWAAKPGDTVMLAPGRYVESIAVPAGVNLVGVDAQQVHIHHPDMVLHFAGGNVLEGVTVTSPTQPLDNSSGAVVSVTGPEVTIRSCSIGGGAGIGVLVQGDHNPQLRIENSTLAGFSGQALIAVRAHVQVIGCRIQDHELQGVFAQASQVYVGDTTFDSTGSRCGPSTAGVQATEQSSLTVERCTFTGIGIGVHVNADTVVRGCTFGPGTGNALVVAEATAQVHESSFFDYSSYPTVWLRTAGRASFSFCRLTRCATTFDVARGSALSVDSSVIDGAGDLLLVDGSSSATFRAVSGIDDATFHRIGDRHNVELVDDPHGRSGQRSAVATPAATANPAGAADIQPSRGPAVVTVGVTTDATFQRDVFRASQDVPVICVAWTSDAPTSHSLVDQFVRQLAAFDRPVTLVELDVARNPEVRSLLEDPDAIPIALGFVDGNSQLSIMGPCLSTEVTEVIEALLEMAPEPARDTAVQATNADPRPTVSVAGGTWEELDALVGLDDVKRELRLICRQAQVDRQREEAGLPRTNTRGHHMLFLGGPGTGKTTVARLTAALLHAHGFLPEPKLTEVGRAELTSEFIGRTSGKVAELVERAVGGVLFIDEAYALAGGGTGIDSGSNVGDEAVTALVALMENHRHDLVVIAAGYPTEMRSFLATNSGLASRFAHTLSFGDLTASQLVDVVSERIDSSGLVAEPGLDAALLTRFAAETRDGAAGSARQALKVFDTMLMHQAERLPEHPTRDELRLLTIGDLTGRTAARGRVDEQAFAAALADLDALVGLAGVKESIRELLMGARLATEHPGLGGIARHLIFTGPPGTGKNTVGRILGRAYAALGLLDRGHYEEVAREHLVGAFQGQSAIRTATVFDGARGGVLLVDEVYSLARSENDDFGREAIDTMMRLMEEHRDELVVIVAGYHDQMEKFLGSNPGLRSRFSRRIDFTGMSSADLVEIFVIEARRLGFEVDPGSLSSLDLELESRRHEPSFGNARFCRQLAGLCVDVFAVDTTRAPTGELSRVLSADIVTAALFRMDRL